MNNYKKTYIFERKGKTEEQIKKFISLRFKNNNVFISKPILTDTTYSFTTYSKISYDNLVNKLVKEKYSDSEEFALINKGIADSNNSEYIEYRNFVANCKTQAKEFIEERQRVIGN